MTLIDLMSQIVESDSRTITVILKSKGELEAVQERLFDLVKPYNASRESILSIRTSNYSKKLDQLTYPTAMVLSGKSEKINNRIITASDDIFFNTCAWAVTPKTQNNGSEYARFYYGIDAIVSCNTISCDDFLANEPHESFEVYKYKKALYD